ncbi:UbiA family prenyltransferase [Deinococcus sonorensis]|uniref:UbiA family prenyltransferase n=2 Tax=Deinococcus sonorensis TaxID=309891 RepID=A0AAU7UGI6_9DEIO
MSSSAVPLPAQRFRAHLSLARISNSPTVASNVLAGAALAGSTGLSGRTVLLMLSMVLFYTAGMYLNDLLDLDIDRRERPERPLPSGTVPLPEAWAVTGVLFVGGLALLATQGLTALLSGLGLAALIVVYDAWHKRNPLSPLLMAGTRVLVYVTAFLALAGTAAGPLLLWALLMGGYIMGLTYIAKTENRSGLARGWPAALVLLPAAVFVVSLFRSAGSQPLVLSALLLLAFVGWAIYSMGFVYRPERRNIGRAVGSLIAGVSLLDALVLLASGAHLGPVLLAVAAFALTVYWQRHIKGT